MADSYSQQQLLVQCRVDGKDFPFFAESGYFSFVESMDLLFPVGEISVREGKSLLQSHYPLAQGSELDFYLQDDDESKHLTFYPYNSASIEQASTKIYDHKISLISRFAYPLSMYQEYHSEYGTASDYVRGLAGRLGLRHDVEETRHRFRWISPGWKAGQMLRHLAQHAVSSRNLSGYVYYVTYEGVLVFKSMDSFFENSSEEESIEISNMNLDVLSQVVKRKYMSTTHLGSNRLGVKQMDLDAEQTVTNDYVHTDMVQKRALRLGLSASMLSHGIDRRPAPDHQDHRFEYPHPELPMLHRKAMSQYEATCIEVTLKKNPFGRKLGDVLHLSFPGEASMDQSVPYSGRYLITKIATIGSQEFHQRVTLMRPGVNVLDRSEVK